MFSWDKVTENQNIVSNYRDHNHNTKFKRDLAVWLYLILGSTLQVSKYI